MKEKIFCSFLLRWLVARRIPYNSLPYWGWRRTIVVRVINIPYLLFVAVSLFSGGFFVSVFINIGANIRYQLSLNPRYIRRMARHGTK